MSDLSQYSNESTAIAENTEVYLNLDFGNKSLGRISASALQNIHSMPPVRKKKILNFRRLLAEGKYDLDERLDVALDRLLEKLVG